MGSKSATTLITNIRDELNEPLSASDLLVSTAGNIWTNSFLLENLNKGKDQLWDIIRRAREDYFQTSSTISITTSTKEYALVSDFRQLKGLKCTTQGYEYLLFRRVDQGTEEFQIRDAAPSPGNVNANEMIYDIIAQAKLKFADFAPAALTLNYDYIQILADYTLSGSSTTNINDELLDYAEAYAIYLSLLKNPEDKRIPLWRDRIKSLEEDVFMGVSKRNIRESRYAPPYDPS